MVDELGKERKWKDRIRDRYRLVLLNEDSFREMASYRLTPLNLYIIISSILVFVALLVVLLIIWTPLKEYIPGYADVTNNREFVDINRRLVKMEEAFNAQELYIQSLQRILTGDPEYTTEDQAGDPEQLDSFSLAKRIREDEMLREGIEQEEKTQSISLADSDIGQSELGKIYFMPPVSGEVSLGYAPQKKHFGLDIMAPKNTPIKAVRDGYVFISDWTLETGNTIGIQHSNDLVSFYKHNSVLLKKAGDFVKAGEAIAIIGNTGTLSDGPHLHFELWYKGTPVNPSKYLYIH